MLLKSDIKVVVAEQKASLQKRDKGLARQSLGNIELQPHFILIITGIRRCGKSTLMNQLQDNMRQTSGYFNFEDPRIFGFELSDFQKLEEVLGDVNFYFFDEIQNVEQWEIFIRKLHDRNQTICITGSNASLLSKELGTRLTGRNIQIELFPFSFGEFCSFFDLKKEEKSLERYLDMGGFPDYLKIQKTEYLQQLFKDILYRDIVVRHGIRNAKTVEEIALFLISNVGKEYSLNGIKKTFGVGSANSVADYIAWLEDSYLLFSLPRFSWSLKSIAVNPKKIYTIDTGFAQANSLSFSEDKGRLLENLAFLHLRRKYKQLYYFKDRGECDFVVQDRKKTVLLVQVCHELHTENREREVNGLREAMQFFGLREGLILTMGQEDELTTDEGEIRIAPAYKWLE